MVMIGLSEGEWGGRYSIYKGNKKSDTHTRMGSGAEKAGKGVQSISASILLAGDDALYCFKRRKDYFFLRLP